MILINEDLKLDDFMFEKGKSKRKSRTSGPSKHVFGEVSEQLRTHVWISTRQRRFQDDN